MTQLCPGRDGVLGGTDGCETGRSASITISCSLSDGFWVVMMLDNRGNETGNMDKINCDVEGIRADGGGKIQTILRGKESLRENVREVLEMTCK